MSSYDTTYTPGDKLRKQERQIYSIYFFICVAGIIGAILYANESWGVLSFKSDLAENWNDIFTKYVFIIIAIERAAAVYVGLNRSAAKRSWDRRIKRVRDILEKKRDEISLPDLLQFYEREKKIMAEFKTQKDFLGILDPAINKGTDKSKKEELWAYHTVAKSVYEFKRTKYEEITHQKTTRLVFVGGVIVSVIGLSIFGDIFDASSLDRQAGGFWWQMTAYRLADIIVTGGLLGGGSKSFNIFLETLGQQLNKIKDPKGEG